MITIAKNQFKMTFPNGWVVSIVNHGFAYCGKENDDGATDTAEAWAWHSVTDERFGDVRGHLSPIEVMRYLDAVSALPASGKLPDECGTCRACGDTFDGNPSDFNGFCDYRCEDKYVSGSWDVD
jgi:hypothetical protein